MQKKLFDAVWNQALNPQYSRFLRSFAEFQISNLQSANPSDVKKVSTASNEIQKLKYIIYSYMMRWDHFSVQLWPLRGPMFHLNEKGALVEWNWQYTWYKTCACCSTYPHAFYPSEKPCGFPWNRTRASAVRSLRLKYLAIPWLKSN